MAGLSGCLLIPLDTPCPHAHVPTLYASGTIFAIYMPPLHVSPSTEMGHGEPITTMAVATVIGEFHDQGEAKWIVIRGQLRGHNDTPFGRPT
jgi:hypothetical protein